VLATALLLAFVLRFWLHMLFRGLVGDTRLDDLGGTGWTVEHAFTATDLNDHGSIFFLINAIQPQVFSLRRGYLDGRDVRFTTVLRATTALPPLLPPPRVRLRSKPAKRSSPIAKREYQRRQLRRTALRQTPESAPMDRRARPPLALHRREAITRDGLDTGTDRPLPRPRCRRLALPAVSPHRVPRPAPRRSLRAALDRNRPRRATITISSQLVQVGWATEFGEPKSDASGRVVFLDDVTTDVLNQHKQRREGIRDEHGSAWNDRGLVFTDRAGGPLHPAKVTERFQELVREANLPPIRLTTSATALRPSPSPPAPT